VIPRWAPGDATAYEAVHWQQRSQSKGKESNLQLQQIALISVRFAHLFGP
jgi:hypothetical protein